MPKPIIATGNAPNDTKCGCEREGCHSITYCHREAVFEVEAWGHKQYLCPPCFNLAKRETNDALHSP